MYLAISVYFTKLMTRSCPGMQFVNTEDYSFWHPHIEIVQLAFDRQLRFFYIATAKGKFLNWSTQKPNPPNTALPSEHMAVNLGGKLHFPSPPFFAH